VHKWFFRRDASVVVVDLGTLRNSQLAQVRPDFGIPAVISAGGGDRALLRQPQEAYGTLTRTWGFVLSRNRFALSH
jgi:hypothetical protein